MLISDTYVSKQQDARPGRDESARGPARIVLKGLFGYVPALRWRARIEPGNQS